MRHFSLYTDGGARGNPGPAAWAFVIKDDEDNVLLEKSGRLGSTTNNQAEYHGLVEGLKAVVRQGSSLPVQVHMDSELVIKQMQGLYKVKHPDLQPLYLEALKLSAHLPKVKFTHIPRLRNAHADRLVNECLDA